ncbi:MAG: protein jag [Lachnospiraceae bacterium]|nr:protein jag [Lachnospiraceae bacterium]
MAYSEFKGKTVEEALTNASIELGVASTDIDYEVIDKGSSGFLGLGAKQAVIKAKKKGDNEDTPVIKKNYSKLDAAKNESIDEVKEETEKSADKVVENKDEIIKNTYAYLEELFKAMDIDTKVTVDFDDSNNSMNINLEGPEMGILIGKRGQTLDALQYLISLFVNKESKAYIRVKLDTENYRARRKDTLENLAKNLAFKVKRSRRSVTLEPMNPYERRIIHSALQNDKYVATRSEGEEPYRKVVIYLKK